MRTPNPHRGALHGTLLFHLNLCYSAIEVAERGEVLRRCYWPLLGLVERLPWLTLTIEISGYTLECAQELDPGWVACLRQRLEEGRVELVGSGDSQLIGPLVPAAVNRWNQALGQETYARLLGCRPRVALVNEMAWSQGIIDAYVEAGYHSLVMEWNNPRRSHPEWKNEWRYGTATTSSPDGNEVEVLWADAVAFQKLQRAVMGDLPIEDYVAWILSQRATCTSESAPSDRHIFLYANDAEVFDYRPGRFEAEPALETGAEASEWERLEHILSALHAEGVRITSPSEIVESGAWRRAEGLVLNAARDPIPVKKQPKYNATRWGLTGRDDVRINARCFERALELEGRGGSPDEWRALCRSWSSDFRTHLTAERWAGVAADVDAQRRTRSKDGGASTRTEPGLDSGLRRAEVESDAQKVCIRTDGVRVTLLVRRGLAIESLAFPSVSERPILGTLPHGYFDDIDWAADFYSGHAVLDIPAEQRVTDLGRAEPEIVIEHQRVSVTAKVATPLGPLVKSVRIYADRVEVFYGFSAWGERKPCTLRAGFITLFAGEDDAGGAESWWVTCANGGRAERLPIDGEFDHGASVSPLVSAHTTFGATEGRITLDNGRDGIELSWAQDRVAALPLLTCRSVGERRFMRLAFSLAEIDETHRPGAQLNDFQLTLQPGRIAA